MEYRSLKLFLVLFIIKCSSCLKMDDPLIGSLTTSDEKFGSNRTFERLTSTVTMGQPKCDLQETEPWRYIYMDYQPDPKGLRFYPTNHNTTLTFTTMGERGAKMGSISVLSTNDWHFAVFNWTGHNDVKITIDGSRQGGVWLYDVYQNFTSLSVTSSHHTYWIDCSRKYIMGFCGEVNKIGKSVNNQILPQVTTPDNQDSSSNDRNDRKLSILPDHTTKFPTKTSTDILQHITTTLPTKQATKISTASSIENAKHDARVEHDSGIICENKIESAPILKSTATIYTLAVVTAVLSCALIVLSIYTYRLRKKFKDMDPMKGDMALHCLTLSKDRKVSAVSGQYGYTNSGMDRKMSMSSQPGYTNNAMN